MTKRIAVIGAGTMGEAIVRGLIERGGWSPGDIACTAATQRRCATLSGELGVATSTDNVTTIRGSDVVLLALKPQVLVDELETWPPGTVTDGMLVVSVAAGVTTAAIESRVGAVPVVRAMPNTPLVVGAGMTVLAAGAQATAEHVAMAQGLFAPVGDVVEIDEDLVDAVTAVSGSGPAYVFRLVEAWTQAAVAVGIDAPLARRLVTQTIVGSAAMLQQPGAEAARLRADVTSPGGTTAAGLAALEEAGFVEAIERAVSAARRRARELGAQ